MYRFRSIENLLEKQELEKQQIYFASLEQLNDPLEGNIRYYWDGDKIVWENLLKNYLLCLERVILISRILDDNKTFSKEDLPIFNSIEDLPTKIYKERMKKIYNRFFTNKFVDSYINFIIKNPNKIYIEEMYIHLKILFVTALKVILQLDIENGLLYNVDKNYIIKMYNTINMDFYNIWYNLEKDKYNLLIDLLNKQIKSVDNKLLLELNKSPKLQDIYIKFNNMYLDAILELTYPKAYLACFMDNCLNSSIWSHYGCNHTGVCLKFKTQKNNQTLALKTPLFYNDNYINYELKPVEYTNNFKEVDFFRNLGRFSISKLKEQWYTNEKNELSVCSNELLSDVNRWSKQHWDVYYKALVKKLPEWSHEREYRIILNSSIDHYDIPKNRLLEYKFEDLEAIFFGMKTSTEAKIKIIDIIKKKCKENDRNNFVFYEMVYSNIKKQLYPEKLLL